MLQDAPDMAKMKDVIVIAGANDIHRESETLEEFEAKVSKGVELFQHAASRFSQALTFVTPPLPADLSPLEIRKNDRLNVLLTLLSVKEDNQLQIIEWNIYSAYPYSGPQYMWWHGSCG